METSEFFGTSLDIFKIDWVVFGFGGVAFGNRGTHTRKLSCLLPGKSWQVLIIILLDCSQSPVFHVFVEVVGIC